MQLPDVEEVRFFKPREATRLEAVIEAINDIHSYLGPVMAISEVLHGHAKRVDDKYSPYRWWDDSGEEMT